MVDAIGGNRQAVLFHFVQVAGQAGIAVGMLLVTCQEAHLAEAMLLQQMLHQRADGHILVGIIAVVVAQAVADAHHGTLGPLVQHIKQGLAEARHIVGVGGHQRTIQLLHGGKGEHALLLLVVEVRAFAVTHGEEIEDIIPQLAGALTRYLLHGVLKVQIRLVHEYTQRFTSVSNHVTTSRHLKLPAYAPPQTSLHKCYFHACI